MAHLSIPYIAMIACLGEPSNPVQEIGEQPWRPGHRRSSCSHAWCRQVWPRHLPSAAKMVGFWGSSLQDGAPKIAKLPYFSGFMVDITIVNRGYNGL